MSLDTRRNQLFTLHRSDDARAAVSLDHSARTSAFQASNSTKAARQPVQGQSSTIFLSSISHLKLFRGVAFISKTNFSVGIHPLPSTVLGRKAFLLVSLIHTPRVRSRLRYTSAAERWGPAGPGTAPAVLNERIYEEEGFICARRLFV